MRNIQGLFDKCAAALQFPYYFGENWDAFEECIADLDWLPARGLVLLIRDAADLLLDENASQFETFVDILIKANRKWGLPIEQGHPWDSPAKAFHVLLQSISDDFASHFGSRVDGIVDRAAQRAWSYRLRAFIEPLGA